MKKKCQHSGCNCEQDESHMIQRNGGYYCCEHCYSNAYVGNTQSKCKCGHPNCSHRS